MMIRIGMFVDECGSCEWGNSRGCITLTRLRIALSSVTFNSVFPGNFSVRKFALEAFHSRAVLSRSRMKRDCTGNNI